MNRAQIADLVTDTLAHAARGHTDEAADGITRLGRECSNSEMYSACCAIAHIGVAALHRMRGKDGP
jgi:hypothetical protein